MALARRNALDDARRAADSRLIAAAAAPILNSLSPEMISLYLPIGSECDAELLMGMADPSDINFGLPVVVDDRTIVFHLYRKGDRLVAGGFGTRVPEVSAPLVYPDVIVIPMVAFDRRGARLGYGRGHYDRAITRLRRAGLDPKLLGIAFSIQEVARIPVEAHDVHLDWVVTEKETLDFRANKD